MMVIKAIVIASILVLTGCAREVKVSGHLDPTWTKDCTILPPPDKQVYLEASERERNLLWSKVYAKQHEQLVLCNNRLKAIRDFDQAVGQ